MANLASPQDANYLSLWEIGDIVDALEAWEPGPARAALRMNTLGPDGLMERNRAWAARMTSEDPDFFRRLECQQAPRYLWIGCSDSVVGHYGCGGVSAAIDGRRRGLVDHWLHPIRELSRTHSRELDALQDERSRLDRLCELNVMQQIKNVASDVFVLDAWARAQDLSVHGWVYSIGNGLIKDLNVTTNGPGRFAR